MRRSFAVRLAAAFAAVGLAAAAITALLVNVAFGGRFAGYLEEQQADRRDQLAAAIGETYAQAGGWDRRELHRLVAVALMDGGTVRIESPGGQTLWASQRGSTAELHRHMMGSGPLGDEHITPIEVDGEVVGLAAVRLPQPGLLPQDAAFRASVNRMLVAGAVVAGVLALLLGAGLARRTTAPARALTATARAQAAGDRSARVPEDRSDEFGEMARAFNRVADTVEAEDRVRRDFAADVAHELRTPLMILRGEVEALQDGVVAATPEALASLRDETLRLGRLVDDLETLARADATGFSLDRHATDLGQLVTEAAAEYTPAFTERSIELATTTDGELVAMIDPIRVRQVVANLLSNAAKFTPEGGRVRLSVERLGDAAVVAVWNSGPAIPAEELPRVFDRFHRGQHAGTGGSGIGLTVVNELVGAHGGTVEVTSSAEHGTLFTVRLPLRPEIGLMGATAGAGLHPPPSGVDVRPCPADSAEPHTICPPSSLLLHIRGRASGHRDQ